MDAISFADLLQQSNQNLLAFLQTELDLGFMFAILARYQCKNGNLEGYEKSKGYAVLASKTVERLIGRLQPDACRALETKSFELAQRIAEL